MSGLDEIELDEFAGLKYVLIVTSTYGEGEMPDNAELFWEALVGLDRPAPGRRVLRGAGARRHEL